MMNNLKHRILDLSYKYKLSHISSCLNAVEVIDEIYQLKQPDEKFVLSQGHAGLALYVVLEKYRERLDVAFKDSITAENYITSCGTHPERIKVNQLIRGIDCSTGSLGQGLPIAVGMALADRSKNVYCVTSDGELAEGSCYEALRIASEQGLTNLKVVVIANDYSALGKLDFNTIPIRFQAFGWAMVMVDKDNTLEKCLRAKLDRYPLAVLYTVSDQNYPQFLKGLQGHYHVLKTKKELYDAKKVI